MNLPPCSNPPARENPLRSGHSGAVAAFSRGHVVDTCAERGWSQLQNGDLLREAEAGSYDLFVTTDQNLRCQQNITGRRMAILVLLTTSWPRIQQRTADIAAAVEAIRPGDYLEFPV